MDLVFNKCYAAPNQVNKYDYYSGEDLIISGTFRGECNIINPVFTVEYDVLKIKDYNYILVYDLKKFYFIDNIVIINNNLAEIYCSEDVLTSCWYFTESGLRDLNVFVDRNEYDVNENIIDDALPLKSLIPKGVSRLTSLPHCKINQYGSTDTYRYIITINVAGTKSYVIKDKYSTYSNAHILCNQTTLNNFCKALMYGDNWFNGSNPYESVISIHYCAIANIKDILLNVKTLASQEDYTLQLSGNSVTFYVHGDLFMFEGTCNYLESGYINTDFFSDEFNRIPKFIINDNYSRCVVQMPLFGSIVIDSQYLLGNISYNYNFDLNSMSCSLTMTSNIGGRFFEKSGAKFGIDIPFSGSNSLEITRNLIMGGLEFAVGAGLAVATGGSSLALAASGLSTASNTTKTTKINRGKGGNVTSVRTTEDSSPSSPTVKGKILGGINYVSSSVINAASSCVKKSYYSSSSFDASSATYLYFDVIDLVLYYPDYYIPDNYYHLLGGPCSSSGKLSNFYGYTLISGFHLDNIRGLLSEELEILNNVIRSGIILPTPPNDVSLMSSEGGEVSVNSGKEFRVESVNDGLEEVSVNSEGLEVESISVDSEQSTQVDSEEKELSVNEEISVDSEQSTQVDKSVEQLEMSEESYKEMVLRKLSE